jgi:hypothetical protein
MLAIATSSGQSSTPQALPHTITTITTQEKAPPRGNDRGEDSFFFERHDPGACPDRLLDRDAASDQRHHVALEHKRLARSRSGFGKWLYSVPVFGNY